MDLLATARREGAAVAIQQFARSLGVQRADLQGSSGLPRGGGMPAAIGEGLTSQAENARMAEKIAPHSFDMIPAPSLAIGSTSLPLRLHQPASCLLAARLPEGPGPFNVRLPWRRLSASIW